MVDNKIGRNDPCICGSGKKHKKCCGLTSQSYGQPTLDQQLPSHHQFIGHLPSETTRQFSFHLFPGEQGKLSLVPDNVQAAGRPGKYIATFVLSRPGFSPGEEQLFDFSGTLAGDSHLAITPPAAIYPNLPDVAKLSIAMETATGKITFDGKPNEAGFLGKIESTPFEALGFEDAESKAYHLITPLLSIFAANLDIPINVFQILIVDQATGAISARVNLPPLVSALNFHPNPNIGTEFSHYASLYREALNSSSSVYRYLCLFKTIEGIRARRERELKKRLDNHDAVVKRRECFPDDPSEFENWLKPIYSRQWSKVALDQIFRTEVRGKKFGNIIDTYLVPLRNVVAHAILDSGELGVTSDDLFKLERINYWLPATRVIARRMLKNDFEQEFLPHLPRTGDSST